MKKLWLSISGAVAFLMFLVLLLVTNHMSEGQMSQQMAGRWSEKKNVAQISCFFSSNSDITKDQIEDFEHSMDKALQEASITQESENPSARLWADAYSADGRITLSSGKTSLEADAIGIGGDFFLFHPLQLLAGTYFSGNDLMQDYCVIDEDAAWQLFGSNDVAGMTVDIAGIPHIITGVVKRDSGRLAKAAGLDSTLVYVSLETLEKYGKSNGINHFEIVMPNPVSNFAFNHVKDHIGVDEKEMEVLENTSRYSLLSRLKLIGGFGTRSMNGKAIIYPYWENIARGYEDIIAFLTVIMLLLVLYPVILLLVFFIIWWKHKGWTVKEVCYKAKDKLERKAEKIREKRSGKERHHGREKQGRGKMLQSAKVSHRAKVRGKRKKQEEAEEL